MPAPVRWLRASGPTPWPRRSRRGALYLAVEGTWTKAGPFGRTVLPLDQALKFIAMEDIFWAIQ